MKKTIKRFAFFILAGSMILSSCSKDDDDDDKPINENPTINFLVEQGYISSDATLNTDQPFKVKVLARENPTTKKNIDHINVRRIHNDQTIADTTFDVGQPEITLQVDFTSLPYAGEENIEFEAVDNASKKAMISLKITTIMIGDSVVSYTDVTLGSFNEQNFGSFFSASNGQVYFIDEAFQNQDLIDVAFFLGTTSGASLGAPSNNTVIDVFDLDQAPNAWTTFNQTVFVSPAPIDATEFDQIGDTYDFPAFSGSDDLVTQLADNDIIYFSTIDFKLGFIKVNAINPRGDIINIDVKVQK